MIPSSSSSRSTTPNPRSSSPRVTSRSSIRPRNKRLNTLGDQEQELGTTSGTSTPGVGSRAASPIPQKHPSRKSGAAPIDATGNGRTVGGFLAPAYGNGRRSEQRSASPAGGMWNTGWMSSALQQVASSVLGGISGDEGEGSKNGYGSLGRTRRRAGSGVRRTKVPDSWGVEPVDRLQEREIGMGSTREREAAVRAKKTQRILEGRDDENKILDTNGNYKRRTSSDDARPGSAQDDDHALVYIHHVQRTDTFAGVVLRYNCPKEVFKKANGLWSEGGLQFRKTVVLPVDACTVKGRPCEPLTEYGVDLLAPTPGIEDPPFTNGSTWPPNSSKPETSAERLEDDDCAWTHVRWVLIDSSPSSKPVEIARMSRKALGYFPPRRRKSINAHSALSTPRGSLDLKRLSILSQSSIDPSLSTASTPSRRSSNLGPRPSQSVNSIGSYFPNVQNQPSSSHQRRESVGEAADRLGWMRGPGGVGTLGPKIRKPGPGNDGLNQLMKKHFPGLAIDHVSSTSVMGSETAHFGFGDELAVIAEGHIASGAATPSGSQSMGLENAAAAVEGFFRKLAINAKAPGTPGLGARADSDLIELLDGAGSDDGRGFEISPGRVRAVTPLGAPMGTGRGDLDAVVRGRVSGSGGTGKGKSD